VERHATPWPASGAASNSPPPASTRSRGKRLGIVGLGNIGKKVARRVQGFDMDVRYFGLSYLILCIGRMRTPTRNPPRSGRPN
jgi:lactate dehydrogenase-like 2-hydroxyacid dehydrogenase